MQKQMILLAGLGLLGLACGTEPGTQAPEPIRTPIDLFAMSFVARTVSPANEPVTRLSWPMTVFVEVQDNSGLGGVIAAATSVARDSEGAVIVEARATEPVMTPANGRAAVTLELSPGASARLPRRLEVSARVRDAMGVERVLELALPINP